MWKDPGPLTTTNSQILLELEGEAEALPFTALNSVSLHSPPAVHRVAHSQLEGDKDFVNSKSESHKYISLSAARPSTSLGFIVTNIQSMKLANLYRIARGHPTLSPKNNMLQYRCFQPDFVPRDPKAKPIRYKYPAVYDPYGPRPPPSDKILELAEKIATLSPEERCQISPTLREKVLLPKLQPIGAEGMDSGQAAAGDASAAKAEEKAEKTTFNVKLEKFDTAAKLKVIKEIRTFTDLGLKEAKDLVEKVPVILKQQVTKDEANSIIDKIKAVGGVAVME